MTTIMVTFFFFRKLSFENYYRKDPRFKKFKIDIGHFETIPIRSNPKYWSPEDVYKYLSFDPYCKDFGKTLVVMVKKIFYMFSSLFF